MRRIVTLAILLAIASTIRAATFPTPYNTEKETIPFLKPDDALALIKKPDGFKATLFASEPQINQPIQITTDARGRIWVCENNTYAERAKNFDTNLRDRILILEDTDHDGRADKITTFWDQAIQLTAVFPGFGGAFALCPPKLLFIPDRDGNDVPDSEPQVLLDGFDNGPVRHNIANGLKLGPDGWLYGRHGILASSHVGPPGAPADQRATFNAAIWRFHPVTHQFEVVCEGTTNPWGHDWDENGQLFFINTVIGHLWHVIPGAYYKRMYGEHTNPYLYELIDQTADHVHWDTAEKWSDIRDLGVTTTTDARGGGHAHSGFLIYNGDNWPAQYRNTALTVNYHGKRLNNDRIVRAGATYTATHLPDPIQFGDPWFRGVELTTGPDGAVYVADWSDIGECHDDSGIHRTSGRIYKIAYGNPASWNSDLKKENTIQLLQNQLSPNEWLVRQSRQVLQERADAEPMKIPINSWKTASVQHDLRALWANYVTGGFDDTKVPNFLNHTNEHVRAWTVQLLVDQQSPVWHNGDQLVNLAKKEKSGLVLSFLASAIRKASPGLRFQIANELVTHGEFANDPVFPLMVWYAIQPDVPQILTASVRLAEKSEIPKIRRFITRRIFEDLAKNPGAAEQITALLSTNRPASFQLDVLAGIHESLKGVKTVKPPLAWDRVTGILGTSSDETVKFAFRSVQAIFGDSSAIESLRTDARRPNFPGRRSAIETLVQIRAENLTPIFESALGDPFLTDLALRSLATVGSPESPKIILSRYENFPTATKTEAINTLASRPNFALPLLESIQRGQIKRADITATHLRQLRSLSDPAVTQIIFTLWPQLDTSPTSKKAQFEKYKKLLTPYVVPPLGGSGKENSSPSPYANASEGHKLFQQLCATCHTLHGEGAKIGPDLTGSDRKNLDYLLDNIITPSAIVPETYRASTINLKDGRSLTGIIINQTDRALTFQTTTEKLTLQKSDIETQQTSQLSMMPDGLLDSLSDPQSVELIAYLMSEPK